MATLFGRIRRVFPGGHPRIHRPLVVYLARISLWQLVVLFLLIIVVVAILAALVLVQTGSARASFGTVSEDLFLALIGVDGLADLYHPADWARALRLGTAIIAFLLPPIFLGVIIFKFFTIDPIVFRKGISLTRYFGEPVLAVRLYNQLPLQLYDVSIRAYLRVPSDHLENAVQNYELPLRRPRRDAEYWRRI